ncbi:MAG: hypothetical protein AAF573_18695, partial [Bacteroidota bacterium]
PDMTDKNQPPLDFEEVVQESTVATQLTPWQKRLLTLELIPLILIALGLWMTKSGNAHAENILNIGGWASALLYLFFSWYMFKVGKYLPLEVVLSVLCGLVFPVGFLGIFLMRTSWPYSSQMISTGIYGGLFLAFVSILLFSFHLKDRRATVFYRNIIARLLIFSMLLLYLGRIYF